MVLAELDAAVAARQDHARVAGVGGQQPPLAVLALADAHTPNHDAALYFTRACLPRQTMPSGTVRRETVCTALLDVRQRFRTPRLLQGEQMGGMHNVTHLKHERQRARCAALGAAHAALAHGAEKSAFWPQQDFVRDRECLSGANTGLGAKKSLSKGSDLTTTGSHG